MDSAARQSSRSDGQVLPARMRTTRSSSRRAVDDGRQATTPSTTSALTHFEKLGATKDRSFLDFSRVRVYDDHASLAPPPLRRDVGPPSSDPSFQDPTATASRAPTHIARRAAETTMSAADIGRLNDALPNDGGVPLSQLTRARAESGLNHDFSAVRVHTDASAAAAAGRLGAAAYTIGPHIMFGSNRYRPDSAVGDRLLAHELTHVVQNTPLATIGAALISDPEDPEEREASQVADSSGQGAQFAPPMSGPGALIQRTPETWYRGEAVGVGPAAPRAHIHDFGEGLYLTDSPTVAGEYAATRAGDKPSTARRLSVTLEPARLGRVLDLTKDVRWQSFLKSRPTPVSPTNEALIRLANENYGRLFEEFARANNIHLTDYDAIKGPEFVRGGSQICIRTPKIQAEVRAALTELSAPTGIPGRAATPPSPAERAGQVDGPLGRSPTPVPGPGSSTDTAVSDAVTPEPEATPKLPLGAGEPKLPTDVVPELGTTAGEGAGLEAAATRGSGPIRRLALGAAESAAEAALGVVALLVVVIWELVVVPYLARLQREAVDRYRKVLQKEIQTYYDAHLASGIERKFRQLGLHIKQLEDQKKQPYVNISLAVHFDLSWTRRLISGPGMPESILDLNFRSMEANSVTIDSTPVRERAEPLKPENATLFFDNATEFQPGRAICSRSRRATSNWSPSMAPRTSAAHASSPRPATAVRARPKSNCFVVSGTKSCAPAGPVGRSLPGTTETRRQSRRTCRSTGTPADLFGCYL